MGQCACLELLHHVGSDLRGESLKYFWRNSGSVGALCSECRVDGFVDGFTLLGVTT